MQWLLPVVDKITSCPGVVQLSVKHETSDKYDDTGISERADTVLAGVFPNRLYDSAQAGSSSAANAV
jgi:hypothetical protein